MPGNDGRLVLADDDPEVSVRDVRVAASRIDAPATAVDDVDDLVAPEDGLRPHGRRDLAPPPALRRALARPLAKPSLDGPVERFDTDQVSADGRQDLPVLRLRRRSRVVALLRPEEDVPLEVGAADRALEALLVVRTCEAQALDELLDEPRLELGGVLPGDDLDAPCLSAREAGPHLVGPRVERLAAEVARDQDVVAVLLLAARRGELGVAGAAARKARLDVSRCEVLDDIDERATGADGRQLPRVPHQHEAVVLGG